MTQADGFKALVLDERNGRVSAAVRQATDDELPDGDVTVAVAYSDLNYKDGMILGGVGRLVKSYPHVAGIDFAGVVESSDSPDFRPGDPVILTGWRVGEVRWGGYAARARVKSDWLVRLPEGLSLHQSMAIGTAGLTAMFAVMALEAHGLSPDQEGEVLVTGAAGGVGSVAVALLDALGYTVAASTGRAGQHGYLRDLGAATVVERAELETPPEGPLGKARWRAAIDNVGGSTLAHVLATLMPGGACGAVGLAAGPELNTSVVPFLLRGISLLGIDSAFVPIARRVAAWNRLAAELPLDRLAAMTRTIPLSEVPCHGVEILQGKVRGRTVIDLGAG